VKKTFILILFILTIVACNNSKSNRKKGNVEILKYTEIIEPAYELHKPNKKATAVLVLFGGFPETIDDIKREFKILEIAKQHQVAVLFSSFNRKLWLQENEKLSLAKQLQEFFIQHELPTDNIYIGGFSSGGNVSLLISNFIVGSDQFNLNPKGVFIIDSPIDLAELYFSSEINIGNNFSEASIQESTYLLAILGKEFGNPKTAISNYEKYSAYTLKTSNIGNLKNLINTKLRLYTEPDTVWRKEQRMQDYEQMNAYHIKQLSKDLKAKGFQQVEYIETSNKGYRANGEKHPHSWSIVDVDDLISWMLEK